MLTSSHTTVLSAAVPVYPGLLFESWEKDLSAGRIPKEITSITKTDAPYKPKRLYIKDTLRQFATHDLPLWGSVSFLLGQAPIFKTIISSIVALPIGISLAALARFAISHGKLTGQKNVTIDGYSENKKFYISPDYVGKSPEEVRCSLLASGILGEHISPYQPQEKDIPQESGHKGMNDLHKYQAQLVNFERQHRLMADLGNMSKYGHPVLNLIDSNLASKLVAARKDIYVVTVRNVSETPHHFSTHAGYANEREAQKTTFDFIEKQVQYDLLKIGSPQDLMNAKEGVAFPDDIYGVYKDANQYKEIVYQNNQQSFASYNYAITHKERIEQYNAEEYKRCEKPAITPQDGDLKKVHAFDFKAPGTAMGILIPPVILALGGKGEHASMGNLLNTLFLMGSSGVIGYSIGAVLTKICSVLTWKKGSPPESILKANYQQ